VVQFTTIGASKIEFEFQLLSSFKLEFFGESEGIVVGINFVAVAALVYLARYVSQDAKRQQLETNATESKA